VSGEEPGERVRLRDGSEAVVRPVEPSDRRLIAGAFERMSPESRYRRFLSTAESLSEEDLAYLTEIDHRRHEALIAIDTESGEALGVARFVQLPDDPEAAEVAVAVVDDRQGRGLGTELLAHLTERARQEGVRRYTALVSSENRRVIEALERAGGTAVEAGDVTEYTLALPQTGLGERLRHALRAAAADVVRMESLLAQRLGVVRAGQSPTVSATAAEDEGADSGPDG
jgi:RimJ/RimL family protein N-acetyltransferase